FRNAMVVVGPLKNRAASFMLNSFPRCWSLLPGQDEPYSPPPGETQTLLQTRWRWAQSRANPSLLTLPLRAISSASHDTINVRWQTEGPFFYRKRMERSDALKIGSRMFTVYV